MILSYKQINDIAQEITSSYCGDVCAPVDIEGLLKDKLGISILMHMSLQGIIQYSIYFLMIYTL